MGKIRAAYHRWADGGYGYPVETRDLFRAIVNHLDPPWYDDHPKRDLKSEYAAVQQHQQHVIDQLFELVKLLHWVADHTRGYPATWSRINDLEKELGL